MKCIILLLTVIDVAGSTGVQCTCAAHHLQTEIMFYGKKQLNTMLSSKLNSPTAHLLTVFLFPFTTPQNVSMMWFRLRLIFHISRLTVFFWCQHIQLKAFQYIFFLGFWVVRPELKNIDFIKFIKTFPPYWFWSFLIKFSVIAKLIFPLATQGLYEHLP